MRGARRNTLYPSRELPGVIVAPSRATEPQETESIRRASRLCPHLDGRRSGRQRLHHLRRVPTGAVDGRRDGERLQQVGGYWMTSVACCRTEWGIINPRASAVLRLMTNSNLVGCSTGRSAGFVPLRILST